MNLKPFNPTLGLLEPNEIANQIAKGLELSIPLWDYWNMAPVIFNYLVVIKAFQSHSGTIGTIVNVVRLNPN